MLQYLVNITMIWLLSLLVFHIFLRSESYHSYNRLYLLLTFLLGIVLPAVQWQDNDVLRSVGATQPVAQAIYTKQAVVQAATIETASTIDWVQWIWIAYYTGVAVSILLLVKELVILGRYYKSGTRSKDGIWHIVETGKQHSPFSVARYIFISSKDDYSPAELRMVFVHEKEHGRALHFIDMLTMEAGKIIFWFHPLVYLFQKNLLMLHEYQADAAVTGKPNEYGRFLIGQSMLQTAPALSHSLTRSPIKKRIIMLTRTSSFKAGFKRLIAIPLCIICLFLFTKNAVSKNGGETNNKVYYNGNEFELKPVKLVPWYVENTAQYKLWMITTGVPDTFTAQNPATGAFEKITPLIRIYPAKMNGQEILKMSDLSKDERNEFDNTTAAEINSYFLKELEPVISKLKDGYYPLYAYIIVDQDGKIVYIQSESDPQAKSDLPAKEALKIVDNAGKKFTPVKHAGKAEIIRLPRQSLYIKNHKAFIREPGC